MKLAKLVLPVALAFLGIVVGSLAVTPVAIAFSSGSDYPIEIIRAHTVYKTAPVPIPTSAFLTARGSPSPDVKLGRESSSIVGGAVPRGERGLLQIATQQYLLRLAGYAK